MERESLSDFIKRQRQYLKENKLKTEKASLSKEREAKRKLLANTIFCEKDGKVTIQYQNTLQISE